ncbi:zinc-binding dehydrogenase [Psychrobacter sp. 72-O-c]|uniref:zinc-binding dehydrogenase n=1 Tax=Psychrobacter sp. 72-O-c TaxID=2774125 RepID=UPI001918F43E|nr:zinc-binding dehydrogenase [Psychrobacter sp. 72-O-c]
MYRLILGQDNLNIIKIKFKSLSFHWQFMFARSLFQVADMEAQGHLLNRVSDLINQGHIQTTVGKNIGIINAANLRVAHQALESGTSIGKIVLENF